jgi:hypothetical protein
MSTVSVVMATYNGADFLAEQLKSLAAQSRLPDELVVSDDGSSDATRDIVDRFADHAPFPVVVRQNLQRLGYGENFLSAAGLATGDYIAFCDQDDVWRPNKIAVSLAQLASTEAELFVHTAAVINRAGQRVGYLRQGITSPAVHSPLQLAPWGVFYGCTMMFPRRLLGLLDVSRRGPHTFEHEGLLSHDLWIYFLATTLGRVVVDITPLIDYRQHGGNATPSVTPPGLRAWVHSLGIAAHPKLPRAAVADHRAHLLDELSRSTSDPQLARTADRGAGYWRTIGRYERARLDMYAEPKIRSRAGRGARLIRSGGYRSYDRGGLGGRLLLKDLLIGLLRLRHGDRRTVADGARQTVNR